jgi:hypothetical protein
MKAEFFNIKELVSPAIYNKFQENSWLFINPSIIRVIDFLRKIHGPIIVNNWHIGGNYSESGLRDFSTSTGASYSIHKFGGAMDLKFSKTTPKEVFEYILDNKEKMFELGLRRVENITATPTWLHVDSANTHSDTVVIFNP